MKLKRSTRILLYILLIVFMLLTLYSIFNTGNPESLFRVIINDPAHDLVITVCLALCVGVLVILITASREQQGKVRHGDRRIVSRQAGKQAGTAASPCQAAGFTLPFQTVMGVVENLSNSNWLIFAVLFILIMFYLVYMRQRESKRITDKFDKNEIIITSFGVNYYGLESEPGGPLRSAGALVLLKSGIYYRARYSKRELFIPGSAITYIGVTNVHKRKDLHQTVVVLQFLNEDGKEEKAAFRMPYPAQWIAAIKSNLLETKAETSRKPSESG
jgi:hypothetical protein